MAATANRTPCSMWTATFPEIFRRSMPKGWLVSRRCSSVSVDHEDKRVFMIEYPFWVWGTFFGIVLAALFVDIGIVNRRSHAPSRKETLIWSAVWISLALAFNAFVYSQFGAQKAKEFLTGYIIELSLSIDNLFVFLLIFGYF